MSGKELVAAWDEFWFARESPAPMCLFRIVYGALVLYWCYLHSSDLLTVFGEHGVVSTATMKQLVGHYAYSLFFYFPSDQFVVTCYWIMVVAGIAVMLGIFTRFSAIVLFILWMTFENRYVILSPGHDQLLRLFALYIAVSGAGRLFSIDRLFELRRCPLFSPLVAAWPRHLMQLQVAALYWHTFWSKMQGVTWQNGTAVYYATRIPEIFRLPLPYVFDHLWTCQLFTYLTLAIEFSMFSLIWFPALRPWVLLSAVGLHLGMDASLNIPLFQWTMLTAFICFWEPASCERVMNRLMSTKFPRKLATLMYGLK